MRCLVIGCGSIGSRRARLLAEMGHEVTPADDDLDRQLAVQTGWQSDWPAKNPERQREWLQSMGWQKHFDAIFICTPADTHVEIALECLRAGIPTFVEKPLGVSMDRIPELLALAESQVTMGACNMRWAYGLERGRWQHGWFIVSKPLAEWRQGADKTYGPNGAILEAGIHEMDVACSLWGPITHAVPFGDEGCADLRLGHESGRSQVFVNWKEGAPTAREARICVDGDEFTFWPDTSDAMYRSEMQHFLDCVRDNKPTCNPLSNAAHVLEWALKLKAELEAACTT